MQYAGFWRRLLALILDTIVLWIVGAVVGFIIGFVLALVAPGSGVGTLLATIVGAIIGLLYYPLQECSGAQATVGKRALGIMVTDLDGRRVSFGRALGRNLAKFISGVILCIGYLMAAFTARKQALHDMMAGCLVVVGKPTHS